jgi:hypothetical protein
MPKGTVFTERVVVCEGLNSPRAVSGGVGPLATLQCTRFVGDLKEVRIANSAGMSSRNGNALPE